MNNYLKIHTLRSFCINIIQFNQIINKTNDVYVQFKNNIDFGNINANIIGIINTSDSDVKIILNNQDEYFLTIEELIDIVDFELFLEVLLELNSRFSNELYSNWFLKQNITNTSINSQIN